MKQAKLGAALELPDMEEGRGIQAIRRRSVILAITLAPAIWGLVGCASSPKAAPERDDLAKTSAVPDGFARLYVYRPTGRSLLRSLNDVDVDGDFLGTIETGRYVMTHLTPGSHILTVKVRRAAHITVDVQGSTTVEVEASRIYYVRVKPSGVWDHPPQLIPMPFAEGAAALRECVLALGSHYY